MDSSCSPRYAADADSSHISDKAEYGIRIPHALLPRVCYRYLHNIEYQYLNGTSFDLVPFLHITNTVVKQKQRPPHHHTFPPVRRDF